MAPRLIHVKHRRVTTEQFVKQLQIWSAASSHAIGQEPEEPQLLQSRTLLRRMDCRNQPCGNMDTAGDGESHCGSPLGVEVATDARRFQSGSDARVTRIHTACPAGPLPSVRVTKCAAPQRRPSATRNRPHLLGQHEVPDGTDLTRTRWANRILLLGLPSRTPHSPTLVRPAAACALRSALDRPLYPPPRAPLGTGKPLGADHHRRRGHQPDTALENDRVTRAGPS